MREILLLKKKEDNAEFRETLQNDSYTRSDRRGMHLMYSVQLHDNLKHCTCEARMKNKAVNRYGNWQYEIDMLFLQKPLTAVSHP
jgi:hypothetical protein